MNHVLGINNPRPDNQIPLLLEERETHNDIHLPTLSEILAPSLQDSLRTCSLWRLHACDDWLKAEHELERKLTPSGKKDQVQ